MGIHMTNRLVDDGFDLTVCQELSVDHGIFSWFPYLMETPWPTPIVPLAVNMVRAPIPRFQRLADMVRSIGAAIRAMPGDERVLVIATGGMSHQISGGRFGLANEALDKWFLDHLKDNIQILIDTPVEEYQTLGGTEAAELGIWFAMRHALTDDIRQVYSFNTFPALTGCGVIAFEEA